ncbi:MAG: FAD-dependent oxidoreductase [Armatimonadota bacterium]
MRLRFLVLLVAVAAAIVAFQPVFLRSDRLPASLPADVLVTGGSAAGVAAAVAAARQGMIVVLIESRPYLGTVMTGAMLNMVDLSRGQDKQHLIRGIFLEFYDQIGGITFDPMRVRGLLRAKVEAEPGITLLLNTEVVKPIVEDARVRGVVVRTQGGDMITIRATVAVDATDDGDLAAAAGVPFTYGRETSRIDTRTMAATLMFRVADIDWRAITRYAWSQRIGTLQPSGAYMGYAWGFKTALEGYRPEDPRLSAHDLNIGKIPDGTVWINSLQIHDVDGISRMSKQDGYDRAAREVPRLVAYLREHVVGFSNARLVELAPELYIRETRHLRGLYTLTAKDIQTRTRFWDRIGAASYPVDLHQYKKGEQYPYKPVRREYTIPLRALVTARIDGLFVASRAFSATYQAAGSARVIPTTMAMGEGVGIAAAVAVQRGVTPHQLAGRRDLIVEVQERLVRAGALIEY